ncbi:efflux RND transporter periplasmic adaptor subunit [Aquabacterium sp. A08]|uniref:efflux RND transporter periplasmic adaptor subunit n=1 Tax=Aquabacterium sp. A08 TaxID=2718532 RepID=UPI0014202288|nr:efflux RND transporter periplasmic adaptor subunit [Aquabacterium sp. A08]NIC40637.1 efflux RND transporter periplasmic adaptor subunit [Aquabacterium sp. A08]
MTCPTQPLSPRHRPWALVWVLACALPGAWAQNAPAAPATATVAAAVQTARLDRVWLYPHHTAPAQVVPRNESRLAAESSGTLLRWTVDVGEPVRRGQLLAQIDPRDAELALQRAQAARDAAQARLALGQAQLLRARELVAQGFFSPEALAQRETDVALQQAEVAQAQVQWQTARRQLDKTAVRAPFDGSVVQRLAQQGEAVAPGSVLYHLVQSGAGEISATVAPTEVAGLRASTERHFEPQSADRVLPVRLLRITPTLQASSRSQTARLAFVEPAAAAPAGSAGLLRWRDPTPHVSATLLVRRGNALGVFVQANGTARFVPLPGAQEGRAAPVRLPADTAVVVQGQAGLQDGQPLR